MKKKCGFTLIELLAVITISSILMASFIVTYRQFQKSQYLYLTSQQIRSAASQAYGFSLAPEADRFGYGVYCETNATSCVLFTNKIDQKTYSTNPAVSEKISLVEFRSGVMVGQGATVYFAVPIQDANSPYQKKTYCNGTSTEADVNCKIKVASTAGEQTIKINIISNAINIE